jgi:hypothetical protein
MTPVTSARDRHPHHLPRKPMSKSHAESRTLQRAAEAHTYHGTPRATSSFITYSAFLGLRFESLVNPHSVLRPDKAACSAVIFYGSTARLVMPSTRKGRLYAVSPSQTR